MPASRGPPDIVRSSIKDSLRAWKREGSVSSTKDKPKALMPEGSTGLIMDGLKALRPEGIGSCGKIFGQSSGDRHPEGIPSPLGFEEDMPGGRKEGVTATIRGDGQCEKVKASG